MRTVICAIALTAVGFCGARLSAEPDKPKPDAERVKGMKLAVADIEKGVLKLIEPPLPAPAWYGDYLKLLKAECGVVTALEGTQDDHTGSQKAAAGYNDVMRVEIEHRFGVGILGRLQARAEKGFEKAAGKKDGPPFGAEVFVYPEKLTAKDKLTDGSGTKAIEIKGETTLVWIDLVPGGRYAHPTKYVLISADGVRVVDGMWWPVLNGKSLFRDGKTTQIEFPVKLSGK